MKTPNLAKIGTDDLKKRIEAGKFEGATLKEAKELLKKRTEKLLGARAEKKEVPVVKKSTPAKKAAKPEPAKKAVKKAVAKKEATDPKPQRVTLRGILREIMAPVKGDVAAVTIAEARVIVAERLPEQMKNRAVPIYNSEFDAVFNALVKEGVLKHKKQTTYQPVKA